MAARPRAHLPEPRAALQSALGFLSRCLRRLLEFEVVDRVIVLASQAFSAGIPFMIVVGSVGPRRDGRDFATRVVDRFDLHGSSADSVRALFISPNQVRATLTWVGVLLLLFSVSSFTRTLQRMYERAWGLDRGGARAAWRGAVWLAGFVAYIVVISILKPSVDAGAERLLFALLSILPAYLFWLWTPRVLIGPRLAWRRFVPSAGLTTVGMTCASIATPLYMPHLVAVNAQKFGFIGVAFALLSWLVVLGGVLVVAAVVGRQIDFELRGR